MIFRKFYKLVYVLIIIVMIIVTAAPMVLKLKLNNLKAYNQVEVNYSSINEREVKGSNSPLHDIIKIINRMDKVTIENINLNDEYKEIILNSEGTVNLIKGILEELTSIEEVFDVTKINLKENIWQITVIFN